MHFAHTEKRERERERDKAHSLSLVVNPHFSVGHNRLFFAGPVFSRQLGFFIGAALLGGEAVRAGGLADVGLSAALQHPGARQRARGRRQLQVRRGGKRGQRQVHR